MGKWIARTAGVMAVVSLLLWGFAGVPLWAAIQPGDDIRAMLLALAHIVAIIVAAASFEGIA